MAAQGAGEPSRLDVSLKVFGALRDLHQTSEESIVLGADATIRSLLASVRATNPELAKRIESGLADGYLSCLVNGRNARFLQDLDTTLQDGDTVAFLPPVGGG